MLTTAEILKRVRRIEIKTKGLSNHVFAGEYHSAFKGRGMSFSEVREYAAGDDVKSIDWNVTARMRTPFVKVFEEERELTVMLLVDVSASSLFGSHERLKQELITEVCAVLAFSASTNNDKVGVIFFSDKVEKFIPPKKGKSHIMRIISEIYDFHPKQTGTNIAEALKYFNNVMKKKSIAFVMSDFMCNSSYKDALNIASKRHDLIGIKVYDKHETELPDIGLARMIDAETGKEIWVNTSSKEVRIAYGKWFTENTKSTKELFGKCGAELVSINTAENYVIALMTMFKKRESKR